MKSSTVILLGLVALALFSTVNSVAVRSRRSSTAQNASDSGNTSSVNNSDIYNGSDNGNTRSQLCPVATGSNININAALQNLTGGLGNDITGDQSGFNGDYATGIANSLGAAGTAINNGFANLGDNIKDAANDVVNGAEDVVKNAGNAIANAAYDIGNIFSSGTTVTSNDDNSDDDNEDKIENTVDSLRSNISASLDSKSSWTQADSAYNDIVVNLRAILFFNQQEIVKDVSIDNSSIQLNKESKCTFIADGAYPSDSQACINGFNVIQPYLVDFGLAAASNDPVAALYWILQILPGMPSLSNACLNTGFSLIQRDEDSDDCEEQIEDLAALIGDLQNGNYFSTTTQQLRNRYIITRYIPRIAAYCLGTSD